METMAIVVKSKSVLEYTEEPNRNTHDFDCYSWISETCLTLNCISCSKTSSKPHSQRRSLEFSDDEKLLDDTNLFFQEIIGMKTPASVTVPFEDVRNANENNKQSAISKESSSIESKQINISSDSTPDPSHEKIVVKKKDTNRLKSLKYVPLTEIAKASCRSTSPEPDCKRRRLQKVRPHDNKSFYSQIYEEVASDVVTADVYHKLNHVSFD